MAGYMSAWFDSRYMAYLMTRGAGIAFDYWDGKSDWDRDSIGDINAGARFGNAERAEMKFNDCGCEGEKKK